MVSDKTIANLEKRYQCYITIDSQGYWKIHSKDGCPWDRGHSYKHLIKTLKDDKDALARIAHN